MCGHPVLIDLAKDRRVVLNRALAPREQTGRHAGHLAIERQLGAGQHADRQTGVLRRRKAACSGPEVTGDQLIADFCGPGPDICKTVIAHLGVSSAHSPPTERAKARLGFAKLAEFAPWGTGARSLRTPATA